MNKLERYSEQTFESIKRTNEYGQEFWYARDLQRVLEYTDRRNFLNIIEKAKAACQNSRSDVGDHFVGVNKMVEIGSGAEREVEDTDFYPSITEKGQRLPECPICGNTVWEKLDIEICSSTF